MKNILLPIFLIFTSSNAFFIEASFLQSIENYKNAYNELEKHMDQISPGFIWHICKTKASYDSLTVYKEAQGDFRNAILINALGDGFILGGLAACCNRILNGKILNKKIILSTIVCIIGMAYYKNYKIGEIPYFDNDLKRHANEEIFSINLALPLFSSFVGYLGMEYTLIKIADILKSSSLSKKQDENAVLS